MTAKHVLKLSAINEFFAAVNELKLIAKGENALTSGHMKQFTFIAELGLLKAEVYASMKNRAYNVEINLDTDGQIKEGSCTCPRGQFVCHHMAATCLYGHEQISVTDVQCQWTVKRPIDRVTQTVEASFNAKPHRSTDRNLTDQEVKEFHEKLLNMGTPVGFTWLLQEEPVESDMLLPAVEELLFSEEYLLSEEKENLFSDKMNVSQNIIKKVCHATVGQAKNASWLTCRKNRLTASNFGVVLGAIQRGKYPPSLFKRLTGVYNMEHVRAIQWGCQNEPKAMKKFEEVTRMKVEKTGLWIDPCGFLGASPDGLVGSNAIVEIKCPYKFRAKSISQELKVDCSYIVYLDEDLNIFVNKKHEYFHQIQGTLAITGRSVCYLAIWTPEELLLCQVEKDEDWASNIELFKVFYQQQYIPFLLGNTTFDV